MAATKKASRFSSAGVITAGRRRRTLRAAGRRATVDALLITAPQDVAYLSGFFGEDSFLLLASRWAVLITDGRYTEQAEKDCPRIDIHRRGGPIAQAVAECLRGRRVRRLGVQSEHLTLAAQRALQAAVGPKKLIPLDRLTHDLRMCKDESEIRAIRKAVRIGEQAFSELTARGAKYWIGRSEKQLAAELEYLMRLGGADEVSFPTIIAVGSHGSLPHYLPAGRRVRRGDPILIDWGARVAGYCGDLTRVVFAGTIPPKIAHLYEVVWKAQQAGIAAIRPGVRCSSVDAAARAVIEQAGLGEKCLHGLGHGLGREVHESPSLGRVDNRPLRAGMVVTVEPGVYWPGLGGVRIEDDILVTARGARWLSTLPRAIEHMVLRG